MLVLARRAGESIIIGDDIEICLFEIQGDKARIGISAPKNVRVLRKELLEELKQFNTEAAGIKISLHSLADAIKGNK